MPNYSSLLLPPENRYVINYNLRNSNHIHVPHTHWDSSRRSFIPFSINLWNQLALEVQSATSVSEFKRLIKSDTEPNFLYYYRKRWANIHHARLRMGCSSLNSHLYLNLHVADSPVCTCGPPETAEHYFLHCPRYVTDRHELITSVQILTPVTLATLYDGNKTLTYDQNKSIFNAVQRYMKSTRRFNNLR